MNDVSNIDSAIANSPPLPEPLVAWRLLDSRLLRAHGTRLVGTVLGDLGFIDVSAFEHVARGYARGRDPVLARVEVPAGVRVLPLFQVIGSEEGDHLLARGTWFLVMGWRDADDDAGLPVIDLRVAA
jgi:hypothetical protein